MSQRTCLLRPQKKSPWTVRKGSPSCPMTPRPPSPR
uniref:Uncharacterized protein n=1 Tax=Anguilla anguilla TaxID=7936 RepID=A0A0E9UE04_ANGAN